jgi:hypothetical protein
MGNQGTAVRVEVCPIGAEGLKRKHTIGANIGAVDQRLKGFQYGSIGGLGYQSQQMEAAGGLNDGNLVSFSFPG